MLGIPHHGMVLESSVFRMGSFYAANWISSTLKGSTKQFGWLQASATKVHSLSITSANPQPSEFVGDFFQADGWGRLPVTQEVAGSSPALYFSRRFLRAVR